MATTESNSFEIERRVILFRPTTTLPDESALGYDDDPNDVINENTAGETLIYNCPINTRYSESDGSEWTKRALQNTWVKLGSTILISLDDTPNSYDTGKYLRSTTSGTEWATVSGTGTSDVQTFLDLTDTPTTYSGYAGRYLKVSLDESELEYATIQGTATTTISGWDVYDATTYYGDFEHNLGTEELSVFIVDAATNKEIGVEDIEIISENTVRIYVVEDTLALKINIITGGIGTGTGAEPGLSWEVISSNTAAESDHGYLVNASGNAVTLTLPSFPNEGDSIGACDIYNKSSTNIITLARNGNNIEGVAEDLIIDTDGAGFTLVYADVTRGWEIVSEIGGAGYSVSDEVYSEDWDGLTNVAPSKNVLYDKIDTLISTFSGTNTVGLFDDAWVQIDDTDAANNDYAKFTTSGIEGRNYSEVLEDLSGQATAAFDWNDQIISRPEIKDYSETRTTPSSSSNVLTLDIENGSAFEVTLTENITTLNFNNPSSSGTACSFDLFLIQDSTPRTVVWPDSIIAEATPDISTASAKYDLAFITMDAGTTWRMYLAGSEMASL